MKKHPWDAAWHIAIVSTLGTCHTVGRGKPQDVGAE